MIDTVVYSTGILCIARDKIDPWLTKNKYQPVYEKEGGPRSPR
jgi:hypothetical protein